MSDSLIPVRWERYAIWMIELKDGTHIGELCFNGLSQSGIAEIGYGILEKYRNTGYAAEAVSAGLKWAFDEPAVTAVETETVPENTASVRVIEKCRFKANGKTGEEGPRYEISRRDI